MRTQDRTVSFDYHRVLPVLIRTRRAHVADTIRLVKRTRLIRLDRLTRRTLSPCQRHLRQTRHGRETHIL